MANETNDEKLNQFSEFFSIKNSFNINTASLQNQQLSYDDFLALMPAPFKLANDIITLDQAALAPLQALSGIAGQLVQYLNHQAQKIDLLVGHIISEQDSSEHRAHGLSFGGGGLEFTDTNTFSLNEIVELKVFLSHENCAIYCHGEVIKIEHVKDDKHDDDFSYQVIFHHIREEDREILVRSSLHLQTKQLQQLAKERNKK
jgi:hypothetical protein